MSDQLATMTNPVEAPPPESVGEVSLAQVDELLQADERAESAPEEEAPAEEVAQPPQPPEEPDMPRGDLRVPLREERERRRQAEQQLQQVMAYQQQMAGAMNQLRQMVAPPQVPQQQLPQVPDFESDPAGHLRHQLEVTQQVIGQMRQQEMARQQQAAAESALAQAENAVVSQEQSFAAQHNDYYEAVDFMRTKLRARFDTLGVPKEHLDQAVAQDLRAFGLKAMQAGANPAEKLFQLAKIEGYNGSAQTNAQKLSTIAKGAAATRGGRSSAPAASGELTLEQASQMSHKDILKLGEDGWAKLMGGA